jgi:hypothetical protein
MNRHFRNQRDWSGVELQQKNELLKKLNVSVNGVPSSEREVVVNK